MGRGFGAASGFLAVLLRKCVNDNKKEEEEEEEEETKTQSRAKPSNGLE